MNLYNIKRKILIVVVAFTMLLSLSCTKQKRSEIIRNEIQRSDSVINVSNNNEEYKYIINRRTGKVHTYAHGTSIVSERYRLETNENIERILENENYDICLTCRAGLKLNLDNYIKRVDKYQNDDEYDLSNKDINLITNYMRVYEFGKIDTETQKFLICIFEVGSWYVKETLIKSVSP